MTKSYIDVVFCTMAFLKICVSDGTSQIPSGNYRKSNDVTEPQ